MAKISQTKQILESMKNGRKLTGMDMLISLGVMNYKGRIHDLRRKGHPIVTEMFTSSNGKKVARYFLQKSA